MTSATTTINSQQIKHYGDNKVDLVLVKLFILPEGTLMPIDLLCNKILIHYITVTLLYKVIVTYYITKQRPIKQ